MMKLNLLLISAAALFNAATADAPLNNRMIDLGSAINYAILAKTGISSVPASDITGNIAVYPAAATYITGFSLAMATTGTEDWSISTQVDSKVYAWDYSPRVEELLITADGDMLAAYNDAAGRDADDDETGVGGQAYNELGAGEIGGQEMKPGVYTFTSAIGINADVTLKGTGHASDIFIIRTTGSLKQAASTEVILDGVDEANVFWQIAGEVEVGTGAVLKGTLLVKTAAKFLHSSILNGRVLAQTACTLDHATIVQP
jgi:hypothetical protein